MYFRIGLCFIICVLLCSSGINVAAQNKTAELQNISRTISASDWDALYSKAKENSFNGNYTQAETDAAQSRQLAVTLESKLLEAKSLRLLGEINIKNEKIDSADANFRQASDALNDVRDVPNKTLAVEAANLLLDFAENQSRSEFFNESEKIRKALLHLQTISQLAQKYSDDERLRDFNTAAEIKQAQILGMSGHYAAQIVLLEKINTAELENRKNYPLLFQTYLGFQSAYRAIGNYEKAYNSITQLKKYFDFVPLSEKLAYLRQLADFYVQTNNLPERDKTLDAGIKLASTSSNKYRLAEFTSARMLMLMDEHKFAEAESFYTKLYALAKEPDTFVNGLDLTVAGAVLASFNGRKEESVAKFSEAERILNEFKNEPGNARFLLYWKSYAALAEKRYDDLEKISLEYLKVSQESGSRDSLPGIYFNLAKVYYERRNYDKARENNKLVLSLIEEKRNARNARISLGVSELLYQAYELSISITLTENRSKEAFNITEKLKGRFLADKLSGNNKQSVQIGEIAKPRILEATSVYLNNPNDESLLKKIDEAEKDSFTDKTKDIINHANSENLIDELNASCISDNTQIISYGFTSEDKLIAFTWSRENGLNATALNLSKAQVERKAFETSQKIKNNLFFKQTGKELFDLLIEPLNIPAQTKQLVIIPDKSLWKIPFQAMSASGEKYLIEEKQISYAPSVTILLETIKSERTKVQTAAVFANSNYQNTHLAFADREAVFVAAEFNSQPILDAQVEDFRGLAGNTDIVHFSMHAEINRTSPLDSFLAFRNGRLTVENLLDLKIKQGSLVFLSSCNTDNVYNSEGLVSLAWGMTAAGAGAVISSQWETDDEAAGMFTRSFYTSYKNGASRAEAIQKAAIEMINNKAGKNKPYYWAEFFLMGDYR
jgi:CHAT domain-containing protein